MNLPEMYNYLVRARRALWGVLEAVPDEALSRPLLGGERFHCIKDLVFHIASVEDFWLHEDIRQMEPVLLRTPSLRHTEGGPEYAGFALQTLLDYWRSVEASTLAYLATLKGEAVVWDKTAHRLHPAAFRPDRSDSLRGRHPSETSGRCHLSRGPRPVPRTRACRLVAQSRPERNSLAASQENPPQTGPPARDTLPPASRSAALGLRASPAIARPTSSPRLDHA